MDTSVTSSVTTDTTTFTPAQFPRQGCSISFKNYLYIHLSENLDPFFDRRMS